jgi:hypothetical protein
LALRFKIKHKRDGEPECPNGYKIVDTDLSTQHWASKNATQDVLYKSSCGNYYLVTSSHSSTPNVEWLLPKEVIIWLLVNKFDSEVPSEWGPLTHEVME